MIKDGILVELSHMPVPDNCYSGLWLTKTKQFWEFDVVVESGNNELLDVERFENISERMRVSTHLRGMGYSFAAVALEILNQLKAAAATTDEEQIAEARLGYASLFGAGHGSFAMPEDVDTFLRQERYAWEK